MRKIFSLIVMLMLASVASAHGPTRQKITEKIVIDAPPETVWEQVKDFGNVEWLPWVASSTSEGGNEEGGTRVLTLKNGGKITEELKKYNAEKMTYSYKITDMTVDHTITHAGGEVEVPVLPVANYSSTFSVKPQDGKSLVTWKGAFYRAYMLNNPPEALNEEAAKKAVQENYQAGLENLKKIVEAKK